MNKYSLVLPLFLLFFACKQEKAPRPNIILIMADDQGWGDVGYNDNTLIQTPHLDAMAKEGIQFNRFYAAAPVCSPTRASCLTGRHPYRMGIYFANTGHLKPEEVNLAEVLKANGYRTGHFGKWHLGTLTNDEIDANRGGRHPDDYAPPWDHGFETCFSTESKVPTWDPMVTPAATAGDIGKRESNSHFGTYYWTGPGQKVTDNLEGDDSRVIMDRVIPFIETGKEGNQPFFAVIWFHTPHLPVIAGEKYRKIYENESEDIQHFYGCITAMDEQIGRLRASLKEQGMAENTLIFYTSDNGPEGKARKGRRQGSTNGLRGRKRSLYEGGVRVPGIWHWPAQIKTPQVVDIPANTSDYYPTILDILDIKAAKQPIPIDGISLKPLLTNEMTARNSPMGFQSREQMAWNDDRYKIYSKDRGETFELYDLETDPSESKDIASEKPEIVQSMKEGLNEWLKSLKKSDRGMDY